MYSICSSACLHVVYFTYASVHVYICICVHVYVYMYMCTCVHVYMCTCVHVYMCTCACIHVHVYMCCMNACTLVCFNRLQRGGDSFAVPVMLSAVLTLTISSTLFPSHHMQGCVHHFTRYGRRPIPKLYGSGQMEGGWNVFVWHYIDTHLQCRLDC